MMVLFSPEPSAKSTSVRSGAGILIFSRRRQLLHMNRRALELTGHLKQTEIGPVNDICFASVQELRIVIQKTLDQRKEANIWEPFELKRVIFEVGRKILVRGFGLADLNSYDDSRIVIVLEEVGLRQERKAQPAQRRSFLPKAIAPSPRNQHDGIPKKVVSDAREWGVSGTSPSLDRMRGVRISGRGLQ